MTNYIIRRLIQAIPLLFIISVIVFALIQIAPNNPLSALQNNPNITPEDLQRKLSHPTQGRLEERDPLAKD